MSDLSPGASPSARRVTKPTPPTTNGTSDPMQDLLHALQAMRAGDFSVRMTGDHLGIEGKIADTFNEIVAANQRMAQQLEHVGQVVGREDEVVEAEVPVHDRRRAFPPEAGLKSLVEPVEGPRPVGGDQVPLPAPPG